MSGLGNWWGGSKRSDERQLGRGMVVSAAGTHVAILDGYQITFLSRVNGFEPAVGSSTSKSIRFCTMLCVKRLEEKVNMDDSRHQLTCRYLFGKDILVAFSLTGFVIVETRRDVFFHRKLDTCKYTLMRPQMNVHIDEQVQRCISCFCVLGLARVCKRARGVVTWTLYSGDT